MPGLVIMLFTVEKTRSCRSSCQSKCSNVLYLGLERQLINQICVFKDLSIYLNVGVAEMEIFSSMVSLSRWPQ